MESNAIDINLLLEEDDFDNKAYSNYQYDESEFYEDDTSMNSSSDSMLLAKPEEVEEGSIFNGSAFPVLDKTPVKSEPNSSYPDEVQDEEPTTSSQDLNFDDAVAIATSCFSKNSPAKQSLMCRFPDCGRTFSRRVHLKDHQNREHLGQRPYVCKYDNCGKAYSKQSHLRDHERTHTGEKRFKCEYENCDWAFSHPSDLIRHQRRHTGEKPFTCSYCGKAFAQQSRMVIHETLHSGEKPLKCPHEGCEKSFAQQHQMNRHVRTHSGEKPYKCDVCGMPFAQRGHLNNHVRGHTGDRPYKCEIKGCRADFKYRRHLTEHMAQHDRVTPSEENGAVEVTLGEIEYKAHVFA